MIDSDNILYFNDDYFAKYRHLVFYIASKMQRSSAEELDDLIQEGFVGLIQARKTYDEKKGMQSTYIYKRIYGAIMDGRRNLDWLTRWYRQKYKDVRSDVLLKEIGWIHDKAYEVIDRKFDMATLRTKIECALENLTVQERNSIRLYYLYNLSMAKVGKRLSISEGRVSQLIASGLKKLSCCNLKIA